MLPLLLLVTLGCRPDEPAPTGSAVSAPSPDCDQAPTWNTFGQGFMTSWCTPCHARALEGDARQGAPEGVDLETLDDVLVWGARIRARAIDGGDMPPGGGPSPDELSRLDTFLACDAPGTPTATGACDAPSPLAGPAVVADATDAQALCAAGDLTVEGDLQLEGDVGSVDCVCAVSGTLHLEGAATLPHLSSVGGLQRTAEATGAVELSSLAVVHGTVQLLGGTTSLPVLETVEGALEAVGPVDAPRLQSADGVELIAVGPHLFLPRLQTAGPRLEIYAAPALESMALESLEGVDDLVLEGLPLTDFAFGFDSLGHLDGDLVLRDLELTELTALDELTTVAGDLVLEGLPNLPSLDGLRRLAFVGGDLRVVDLPAADPEAVAAWADGIEVGGMLDLRPEAPR